MRRHSILVLASDPATADVLGLFFAARDFHVAVATSVGQAVREAAVVTPDLVVVHGVPEAKQRLAGLVRRRRILVADGSEPKQLLDDVRRALREPEASATLSTQPF